MRRSLGLAFSFLAEGFMIFGIAATIIMWVGVIGASMWRLQEARKQRGDSGLVAVAEDGVIFFARLWS
jgi:hypothetical protein